MTISQCSILNLLVAQPLGLLPNQISVNMAWFYLLPPPTQRVLRQFSGAWLVFFLALGARQYFGRGHHAAGLALAVVAIVIGSLGLLKPAAVRWLFVSWMVLAFPIGWVISQIILALIFYGLLTPIAFVFRLQGRDLLCRKPTPGRQSFWTPKQTPHDVRSYFRQ